MIKYRPECECGWTGDERYAYEVAERAALDHRNVLHGRGSTRKKIGVREITISGK